VRATSSVERSGPVSPVRLGDRLEEADLQPGALQGTDQPRLMEVRPTPKSVGAMKNVCMRASRNKRCKEINGQGYR
jgi:hypothetical protein